jgi:cytochrome c-type biogenesis protein CcmH
MIPFLLAALILTLLAAALLLWPLLRPAALLPTTGTDKSAAILREQLDELKAEQAAGTLTAAEFTEAENELKRRILDEHQSVPSTATNPAPNLATAPATKTAAALVLILVLGSFALYGLLGNPLALQPELVQSAARQAEAGGELRPDQLIGMVDKLAARLEANPDDPEGWLMLARSYKMLERPADSAAAYAHIEALVAQDADLLADYAEALAMSAETRLNGKPRQLVKQALQLEPNNRHALFLAGMAALEAGDKAETITYWEKLLPQVEEGSELHNLLTEQIAKVRNQ